MQRLNAWIAVIRPWWIYGAALIWSIAYFMMGVLGRLGPDPAKVIEHQYGRVALYLLIASLMITPLRRHVGINLLKLRRALGVTGGMLVIAHLTVWLVLDIQDIGKAIEETFKRRHLIYGMIAFVLMVPLLVTSNALSLRKMGRRWNQLHRLAYILVPLATIHYVLANKTIEFEAATLLALTILMLLMRVRVQKLRKTDAVR